MRIGVVDGKVKFFNQEKGFGFILRKDDGGEVFFHRSGAAEALWPKLIKDAVVKFDIIDSNGRSKAVNISVVAEAPKGDRASLRPSSPLEDRFRKARSVDEHVLKVWNLLIDSPDIAQRDCLFTVTVSGKRPPNFEGDWGRLNAWCKLIGLKPYWKDMQSGYTGLSGWYWDFGLAFASVQFPDERLKEKILRDYGAPPGY